MLDGLCCTKIWTSTQLWQMAKSELRAPLWWPMEGRLGWEARTSREVIKEAVSVQAKVMGAWTRVETGHILSGFSGHIPQGYCTLLP